MPEITETYIERYIKVYEYFLQQKDLNPADALLLSILTWYPKGCWIGSKNLGKKCGQDIRTIQRKLVRLQKIQWTAILPNLCNNRRYVWVTIKDPPEEGPLFIYAKKAEIEMNKLKAKNLILKTAKQLTMW